MDSPSKADVWRTLRVLPPRRPRPGDQIVELVLQAFAEGAFTEQVEWLPKERRQVDVIAQDSQGIRLAVEHTRFGAFEKHIENELDLLPIAESLEATPELQIPGRGYRLWFHPGSLIPLLRRHPERVSEVLTAWAVAALPILPVRDTRYSFEVPIHLPGSKQPRVRVDVAVVERVEPVRAVSVGGYLPDDPRRWRPVLERVLRDKLPKLAQAPADRRLFLLEHRAPDAEPAVLAQFWPLAQKRRAWKHVDWLALVHTVSFASDRTLRLEVWDAQSGTCCERWQIELVAEETAAVVSGAEPAAAALYQQARTYVQAAKAKNTLRAYEADWRDFFTWCQRQQREPLPADPETVALYLTDRASTLKTSTLSRRLTAIARRHQALGFSSPAAMQHAPVSEVWKGIQRTHGTAQQGKRPLLTADIRRMLGELPDSLQGVRDRALLLVGFAGGFRRSELAGLTCSDCEATEQGIVVRLRRSKTDPTAQGRPVALPYGSDPSTCPVRALRTWLEQAGIREGPLFRAVDQFDVPGQHALHPDSIAYLVKRAAARIGLPAAEFAGHSLRAGLATQAAMNGAAELAIMKQTGHRSLATVRKYIREGGLFRDNAATKLGL